MIHNTLGFGLSDTMNADYDFMVSVGSHENIDTDNVWSTGIYCPNVSLVGRGNDSYFILHTY